MPKDEQSIGRYGRMRMEYLKEHRQILFGVLVLQDKLYEHCSKVNEQAQKRANVMMEQLVQAWGITEEWKSRDQMGWVRVMNQAKHCAEENVVNELIYA